MSSFNLIKKRFYLYFHNLLIIEKEGSVKISVFACIANILCSNHSLPIFAIFKVIFII